MEKTEKYAFRGVTFDYYRTNGYGTDFYIARSPCAFGGTLEVRNPKLAAENVYIKPFSASLTGAGIVATGEGRDAESAFSQAVERLRALLAELDRVATIAAEETPKTEAVWFTRTSARTPIAAIETYRAGGFVTIQRVDLASGLPFGNAFSVDASRITPRDEK